MCFAPQIDPRHLGPYHRQAFDLYLLVWLVVLFAIFLHSAIHLPEHDSPGRLNADSGLGESYGASPMFNRLPGPMLTQEHTHQ